MKKHILFLLGFFLLMSGVFAESPFSEPTQNPNVRYRLFPTQNMWTFLKLDTMTGRIWQVQYSIRGEEYRFETILSSTDITDILKQEKTVGRFTLHPTTNTYNFIMLDQIDGYTYQVQWDSNIENRFVLPIKVVQ